MKSIFLIVFIFLRLVSFSQVTLNLKLFIQGYCSPNGMMNNYGAGGCLFVTGMSRNPTDADTITISLMDHLQMSVVESQKGILKTNGNVTVVFSSATAGNAYY